MYREFSRRDHGSLPTRQQRAPQDESHPRVGCVSVGVSSGTGRELPRGPRGDASASRPPRGSREAADLSSLLPSGAGQTTAPRMLRVAGLHFPGCSTTRGAGRSRTCAGAEGGAVGAREVRIPEQQRDHDEPGPRAPT